MTVPHQRGSIIVSRKSKTLMRNGIDDLIEHRDRALDIAGMSRKEFGIAQAEGWSAVSLGAVSSVARSIEKRLGKPVARVTRNLRHSRIREQANARRLNEQYPNASVQNEQYLRTVDGKIAKDPVTGTGRRVDHVVVEDGSVVTIRETTSMTARKAAQQAHEDRVRAAGGTFIRDRTTGKLLDVSDVPTILDRLP